MPGEHIYITTRHFVEKMAQKLWCSCSPIKAVEKGLITDFDIRHFGDLIERRHAARIIHNTLLFLNEQDETAYTLARNLRDLYSCRTCVNHIAQVYEKGIMEEWESGAFGLYEKVTDAEAEDMISRIRDKRLRSAKNTDMPKYGTLSFRETVERLKTDRKIWVVDVRTEQEFERGRIAGSIHRPLKELCQNPNCICADKEAVIFLYCSRGHKSRIAAGLLSDNGYKNVYVIPGLEQENYQSLSFISR